MHQTLPSICFNAMYMEMFRTGYINMVWKHVSQMTTDKAKGTVLKYS